MAAPESPWGNSREGARWFPAVSRSESACVIDLTYGSGPRVENFPGLSGAQNLELRDPERLGDHQRARQRVEQHQRMQHPRPQRPGPAIEVDAIDASLPRGEGEHPHDHHARGYRGALEVLHLVAAL